MGWWSEIINKYLSSDYFDACLDFVFKVEGYYSNNPLDRGGETKYGISKKAHPHLDIINLTKDQAKEIYRKVYWEDGRCDKMPWPINLIHFDACVHHGVGNANYILRKALPDEVRSRYAKNLITARALFMKNIVNRDASQKVFIKGWFNRLRKLEERIGIINTESFLKKVK